MVQFGHGACPASQDSSLFLVCWPLPSSSYVVQLGPDDCFAYPSQAIGHHLGKAPRTRVMLRILACLNHSGKIYVFPSSSDDEFGVRGVPSLGKFHSISFHFCQRVGT